MGRARRARQRMGKPSRTSRDGSRERTLHGHQLRRNERAASVLPDGLYAGTRPNDGRRPGESGAIRGIAHRPAMSLPCASGVMPAGDRRRRGRRSNHTGYACVDQRLYVRPRLVVHVSRRQKLNAGVLVRPMMTAPAFFQLATTGLSVVAMTSLNAVTPLTVAQASWSMFSLIVTGTPCSGPNLASVFRAFACGRIAR